MWKKIFGDAKKPTTEHLPYSNIDQKRLPKHVALIMDGNGRWATGKGLLRTAGHTAGVRTLKQILKVAIDLEIAALTVYAFSTENWKRPHAEVDFLMQLFSEYLAKEIDEMDQKNVKLQFIGRVDELSPSLQDQVEKTQRRTRDNTGVNFNIAVNYGGREEITRSVKILATQVAAGELPLELITEELIEKNLYTGGLPPVDLVIRTSGDKRLSNFLLWQSAYAEFWFTDTKWPDFTPACFVEALVDFQGRERRFGGLKDENK